MGRGRLCLQGANAILLTNGTKSYNGARTDIARHIYYLHAFNGDISSLPGTVWEAVVYKLKT